jgi:hypothetical protein
VAPAAHHAVPAIYEFREFAVAGGLISYGTNIAENDSPGNQLLLTQATRVTQLALHGNRLLEDQAAGQARLRSVSAKPRRKRGMLISNRAPADGRIDHRVGEDAAQAAQRRND